MPRLHGALAMLFAVDRSAFQQAGLELPAVLSRLASKARIVDEACRLHGAFALLPEDRDHMIARLGAGSALMTVRRPPPSATASANRFFALLLEVPDADRLTILSLCDALCAECALLGDEAAVWLEQAAVVPDEERRALVEGLEEHSAPIPRPQTAPPRPSGPLAGRALYVDASNLAWRAIDLEVSPALALERTREALLRAGAEEGSIDVLFDASFFGNKRGAARRLPRAEWARLERGEDERRWRRTPASTKTDQQILGRLLADPRALVVSNDLFQREREAGLAPADLFDRQLKVDLGPRDLRLSFPRSWRNAPNIVVSLR